MASFSCHGIFIELPSGIAFGNSKNYLDPGFIKDLEYFRVLDFDQGIHCTPRFQ